MDSLKQSFNGNTPVHTSDTKTCFSLMSLHYHGRSFSTKFKWINGRWCRRDQDWSISVIFLSGWEQVKKNFHSSTNFTQIWQFLFVWFIDGVDGVLLTDRISSFSGENSACKALYNCTENRSSWHLPLNHSRRHLQSLMILCNVFLSQQELEEILQYEIQGITKLLRKCYCQYLVEISADYVSFSVVC